MLANTLGFALSALLAVAAADAAALDVSVLTRNAPGASDLDTHQAIKRGLAEAKRNQKDGQKFEGNVTLDSSWEEAPLLKVGVSRTSQTTNVTTDAGIEIICSTCYIKGLAKAQITIDGDFNATDLLNQTYHEVKEGVRNVTDAVELYFEQYVDQIQEELSDLDNFEWEDLAFPTFSNVTLDLDVAAIPEASLKFTFDAVDIFLELNTILELGASYELPLYSSNTPVGIAIGRDLELGILFTVDLLLAAEGEIDVTGGIHLALNESMEVNIVLFGDEVSDIKFNGAQFEFLPLTVESAGFVFTAILRVGAHAGLTVITPEVPDIKFLNHALPRFGGGIEVGVFANLVETVTNITFAPEDSDCAFEAVQEYSLALGAKAGATVQINEVTYGPIAEISTPVWYTTMASVCIGTAATPTSEAPLTASSSAPQKRQNLETVTLTTEITHTAVNCAPTVTGNCPMSLQTTTQTIETRLHTTAVPSGEEAKWPVSSRTGPVSTSAFGTNAASFGAITGKPSSFVPPPPPKATPSDVDDDEDDNDEGDKEDDSAKSIGVKKNVALGLGLGLGLPFLAAIIGAAFFLYKRRQRYNTLAGEGPNDSNYDPYHSVPMKKLSTSVRVTETRR